MVHSCAAHHGTSLLEATRTLQRSRYLGRCEIRERATQTENIASAMATVPATVTTENTNANLRLSPAQFVLSFIRRSILGFYVGLSACVHTVCRRNGIGYKGPRA